MTSATGAMGMIRRWMLGMIAGFLAGALFGLPALADGGVMVVKLPRQPAAELRAALEGAGGTLIRQLEQASLWALPESGGRSEGPLAGAAVTYRVPTSARYARLFDTVDGRAMPSGAVTKALARVQAERTTLSALPVRLVAEPYRSDLLRNGVLPVGAAGEPQVEIPLGGDAIVRTKPGEMKKLDGDLHWVADTLAGDGQVTLIIGGNRVTGTIDTGGKLYTVVPLGEGWHAVVERKPRAPMKDHPE